MVTLTILRRLPVLFLLLLSSDPLFAQDQDRLTKDFHAGRRAALSQLMPPNSVAVIFASPVRNRSNSVDYQYSQNPGFYYLTGHIEPDACLFLFKDSSASIAREILFIEGPNSSSTTWTGEAGDIKELKVRLGIREVYLNNQIEDFTTSICGKKLWISWPEQPRKAAYSETGLVSLVERVKKQIQECKIAADTTSLSNALAVLREVKEPEELVLRKKAIDLTVKGFQKMIEEVEPGVT